jgi:hypothetical protein
VSILKNSGPDFKHRDELIQLHSKAIKLESSINLRKQIEYEYNNLKLEEVKERIDEIQFQRKFFIKRNNDILNDIQKRNLKNLEISSTKQDLYQNIQKQKEKYGDYISSLIPKIQIELNVQLHRDSNKLVIQKMEEMKKLQMNKNKIDYYDKIEEENEKLVKEIEIIKKKNEESLIKSKIKKEQIEEKQKKLKNDFNIDEYYKPNQINIDLNNMKEYSELNKMKLKKDSIDSDHPSLQDLSKQIINPKKSNLNFSGTLHQNFEKPKSYIDINNNIINNNMDKIKDNITPGEAINNNINNIDNNISIVNNINNDKIIGDKNQINQSKFNLLNSEKINDNIISNVNKNDINININTDVEYNLNINRKAENNLDNTKKNIENKSSNLNKNNKDDDDDSNNEYKDFDVEEIE